MSVVRLPVSFRPLSFLGSLMGLAGSQVSFAGSLVSIVGSPPPVPFPATHLQGDRP